MKPEGGHTTTRAACAQWARPCQPGGVWGLTAPIPNSSLLVPPQCLREVYGSLIAREGSPACVSPCPCPHVSFTFLYALPSLPSPWSSAILWKLDLIFF